MEFSELIKIRQSVRKYQDKPVENEKLQKLIESVRLAPSACNSQPWKLIIVDELELKDKVPKAQAVEQEAAALPGELLDDALSALLNLGYKRVAAERAVKRATNEAGRDGHLEDIIRLSLKYLSGV